MDEGATIRRKAARFLPALGVAAGLVLFFALGLDRYISVDALRENRLALKSYVDAHPLLSLGLFMLAYAGAVAVSFPGASILTIFGGFLFGLPAGVPAIVIAATVGATAVFAASKRALGDRGVERPSRLATSGLATSGLATSGLAEMERGFRRNELSYMFVLRLAPVFPFWAVNIAAGVLGVSLRNFLIGTFFGIIPGSFVYASIGNAAGAVFDAGDDLSLSGLLFKPSILAPLIGLIVLAFLPVIFNRRNKPATAVSDARTD